jgi:6-phosphofructokinase 2
LIRHLLHQEGVEHGAVAIAGFTRESLKVDERASGEQFRFILPGPEIGHADQESCLDELSAAAPGAACIVASGSLPSGVPDDCYARVAALAKRFGASTACKANCGPAYQKHSCRESANRVFGVSPGFFVFSEEANSFEHLTEGRAS